MLKKLDESGLFGVPPTGTISISNEISPWTQGASNDTTLSSNSPLLIHDAKHSQVKTRKRYSQKLARQLQACGVNMDVETGLEQCETEEPFPALSNDQDSSPCPRDHLINIADETLAALDECPEEEPGGTALSTNGNATSILGLDADTSHNVEDDDDKESVVSFSNWDPMKDSYENKAFNSYHTIKDPDNPSRDFREKHAPVCGIDGKIKISPTKMSSGDVRLFVNNIPMTMSQDGLRNLFSTYGECYDVKKIQKKEEKFTFGFVSFKKASEATAAIQNLNNSDLFDKEKKLHVKLAFDKNENYNPELRFGDDPERNDETWDYAEGSGGDSADGSPADRSSEVPGFPEYRDARNNSSKSTSSPKHSSNGAASGSRAITRDAPPDEKLPVELGNRKPGILKSFPISGSAGEKSPSSVLPKKESSAKKEQQDYISWLTGKTDVQPVQSTNTKTVEKPKDAFFSKSVVPVTVPKPRGQDHRLYVQGINVRTTLVEFRELFDQIAPSSDHAITQPRKGDQFTTYGFVSYSTRADAEDAIDQFSGYVFKGRTLNLEFTSDCKRRLGLLPEDEDNEKFYDKLYEDDVLRDFANAAPTVAPSVGVAESTGISPASHAHTAAHGVTPAVPSVVSSMASTGVSSVAPTAVPGTAPTVAPTPTPAIGALSSNILQTRTTMVSSANSQHSASVQNGSSPAIISQLQELTNAVNSLCKAKEELTPPQKLLRLTEVEKMVSRMWDNSLGDYKMWIPTITRRCIGDDGEVAMTMERLEERLDITMACVRMNRDTVSKKNEVQMVEQLSRLSSSNASLTESVAEFSRSIKSDISGFNDQINKLKTCQQCEKMKKENVDSYLKAFTMGYHSGYDQPHRGNQITKEEIDAALRKSMSQVNLTNNHTNQNGGPMTNGEIADRYQNSINSNNFRKFR